MAGPIPSELSGLSMLTLINLSCNELSGESIRFESSVLFSRDSGMLNHCFVSFLPPGLVDLKSCYIARSRPALSVCDAGLRLLCSIKTRRLFCYFVQDLSIKLVVRWCDTFGFDFILFFSLFDLWCYFVSPSSTVTGLSNHFFCFGLRTLFREMISSIVLPVP